MCSQNAEMPSRITLKWTLPSTFTAARHMYSTEYECKWWPDVPRCHLRLDFAEPRILYTFWVEAPVFVVDDIIFVVYFQMSETCLITLILEKYACLFFGPWPIPNLNLNIHGETLYYINSQSKLTGVLKNCVNNELKQTRSRTVLLMNFFCLRGELPTPQLPI